MTLDEQYIESLMPDTFVVLGAKLEVLTLWHIAILFKIGSPFLVADENAEVSEADIRSVVTVCSCVPGGDFGGVAPVAKWRMKRLKVSMFIQRIIKGKTFVDDIARTLREYFDANMPRMKVWTKQAKEPDKTVTEENPFVLGLITSGKRLLRMSGDEIMRLPIRALLLELAWAQKVEGRCDVESQDEFDAIIKEHLESIKVKNGEASTA